MTSELKPCPFCGEEVDMYDSNSKDLSYFVSCFPCDISIGKNLRTKKAAMTAWNARAVPDVPALVRYDKSDICLAIENGYDPLPSDEGEYVRYDQAAAMLAAKDAEIVYLRINRDSWRRVAERCKSEEKAAEAKLAHIKAQYPVGTISRVRSYDTGIILFLPYDKNFHLKDGSHLFSAPVDQSVEIDRLREALKLICNETAGVDLHVARDIARAALSERSPS